MAQRRNGAMAQRRNGATEQWRNGAMVQRRNGERATDDLAPSFAKASDGKTGRRAKIVCRLPFVVRRTSCAVN